MALTSGDGGRYIQQSRELRAESHDGVTRIRIAIGGGRK
jgi:hypothetical protein